MITQIESCASQCGSLFIVIDVGTWFCNASMRLALHIMEVSTYWSSKPLCCVNDKSCPWFKKHAGLQVACSAQAQLGRILVFLQVSNQASVLSLAIDGRDPSAKKINVHRGVGVAHLLDI